jgi:hypothetical protein
VWQAAENQSFVVSSKLNIVPGLLVRRMLEGIAQGVPIPQNRHFLSNLQK